MSGVWIGEVDPAQTRALRRAVLRPQLGPDDPIPGDDVPDAVHLAALDDHVVLSTCFVQPAGADWVPSDDTSTQWRLRSMATLPALRGQGLGALVLAAAVDAAGRRGGRTMWAHARLPAERFYVVNGWSPVGDTFPSEGVEHRHIWRRVDASTG